MERSELFDFMRQFQHAVLATVSPDGAPEAALVGIAITPELDLIFDTLENTRKCANLRKNPHIAFVFSGDGPQTLQYEGLAFEPSGAFLEETKVAYFSACPSGLSREVWPGITYFRVRPRWVRLSNYFRPRSIREMSFPENQTRASAKRASLLNRFFRP